MEDVILEAIKRANKLGARGIQVVEFGRPSSAIHDPWFILIVKLPELEPASNIPWYDK